MEMDGFWRRRGRGGCSGLRNFQNSRAAHVKSGQQPDCRGYLFSSHDLPMKRPQSARLACANPKGMRGSLAAQQGRRVCPKNPRTWSSLPGRLACRCSCQSSLIGWTSARWSILIPSERMVLERFFFFLFNDAEFESTGRLIIKHHRLLEPSPRAQGQPGNFLLPLSPATIFSTVNAPAPHHKGSTN